MVIAKGSDWGHPISPVELDGVRRVASDRSAAAMICEDAKGIPRGGAIDPQPPSAVIVGGDLFKTLGSPRHLVGRRIPVDLLKVTTEDQTVVALAHVIARGFAWRGRAIVAMNAQFLGPYNLGPKAHPNDAIMDITEGTLGMRDSLAARKRARSGSHIPHPSLSTSRVRSASWTFDSPLRIIVDGVDLGRRHQLSIDVIADAGWLAY
ncbi:MAG TPA: hypothetical protein DEG43_02745 [Acidimicrobiaceae bacterium]|jgi:hypothetical protein|nr:hypothetical protein [Acidimicrobiaceae bacterium]